MQPNPPLPPDDEIETALRAGLRSSSLSAEAMQRVRAAVASEWQSAVTTSAPRPVAASRPRWRWLAAASVAAVAVSVSWLVALDLRQGAATAAVATVMRAEAQGVRVQRVVLGDQALPGGAVVHAGQKLHFDGAALLALGAGATLRVASGTSIEVLDSGKWLLKHGEVYVDMPAGAAPSLAALAIVTDDGEFRHMGTQFAVARMAEGTRLRVREGRVSWRSGAMQEIGEAGTQFAIRSGQVRVRKTIARYGADWQWVEALAPVFAIENRPLIDYLMWAARETGLELQFADAAARSQAAAIVLHGSVRGLPPRQALARVMATTSLRYELSARAIRVSLPREVSPPPR